MMSKTLRAQIWSKTLTRVPRYVSSSASLYLCQVCIVVRKKTRTNNFQAICKIHPITCIRTSQHAFIDILMIIRGEIKVFLCFP